MEVLWNSLGSYERTLRLLRLDMPMSIALHSEWSGLPKAYQAALWNDHIGLN